VTAVDARTTAAVDWLCASDEPAIRAMARRDLLDDHRAAAAEDVVAGPKVSALLSAPFPKNPYSKWAGAHWRLVSLVELELPPGEPRARPALESVVDWLAGPRHRAAIVMVDGRTRRCASQEGNALAVACRLGRADDPRVRLLADSLVEWQWPDGGWNCDRRPDAWRSSFHESLAPAWGLHEHWRATGTVASRDAARRAAELFLAHRVFRATATGDVIHPSWAALHYPPYWHYDVLQALVVLSRLGLATDPRAADGLDLLERRRLSDGRWRAGGRWNGTEVVDWGRSGPNEMITLNALRVLRTAGRLSL
jgi:hypothetical protein